jgi:syntaxin 1B/2/3
MPHRQTDERHNPYGNVDLEYGHQETGTTAPDFHENPLPPSQHYGGRHHHPHATVLANPVFLARIESVRKDIEDLSIYITQISTLHQRAVTSTDSSTSAAIENTVAQTQVLNTTIRDQIRYLEIDAARSGGNVVKNSQIRNIKNQFKNRIDQFQQEEVTYRARYQEQIARQYLVIHPDANEAEIREAAEADWGDEGIFQAAVRQTSFRHDTIVYFHTNIIS